MAEPLTERSVVFLVVCLLGACALVGLTGVILLMLREVDPVNLAALTALVGPAIGGLASILATTRTSPSAGRRSGGADNENGRS